MHAPRSHARLHALAGAGSKGQKGVKRAWVRVPRPTRGSHLPLRFLRWPRAEPGVAGIPASSRLRVVAWRPLGDAERCESSSDMAIAACSSGSSMALWRAMPSSSSSVDTLCKSSSRRAREPVAGCSVAGGLALLESPTCARRWWRTNRRNRPRSFRCASRLGLSCERMYTPKVASRCTDVAVEAPTALVVQVPASGSRTAAGRESHGGTLRAPPSSVLIAQRLRRRSPSTLAAGALPGALLGLLL